MAPVPGDSSKYQFGTSMPQGGHPPHHSITSSARASSVGGISMPSALAVFRLMISSNLVGACNGSSFGFSPLECDQHTLQPWAIGQPDQFQSTAALRPLRNT